MSASVASGDGGVNLRNEGAAGDGFKDDAPALQSALDRLAAAGGGTLVVPPGIFRVASPVSRDLSGAVVAVVGAGSSSQFLLATGLAAPAITLQNAESILFEDLVFLGTPGSPTDARYGIRFEVCLQATFRRCDLYGLSSTVEDGAVVSTVQTDLRVENSAFRGCGGNSGVAASVLRCDDWRGLSMRDVDFIDHGTLNGVFHSKTPIAAPEAWVRMGNTAALTHGEAQNKVVLDRVRMDEGAFFGFACLPNASLSGRVASIVLSGLRVNVSGFDDSRGCRIQHAGNVRIEFSWFGYTKRPRDAIVLRGVDDAVIDACLCGDGAAGITADNEVRSLHVRESTYLRLRSDAEETVVTKAGVSAWLQKADGAIAANSLVVHSPTTDRRVVVAPAGTSGSAISGVALDTATAAGDQIRVLRLRGASAAILSDGTTAIHRGDPVGPSKIRAGRIRSVMSGEQQIGRAVNAVPVATWATPTIELSPGIA